MKDGYHFDTRLLRNHVLDLQEERRVAQRLSESVRLARNTGAPFLLQSYNQVLNSIENLQRYFQKMAEALESIADEATALQQSAEVMLQDSTEQVRVLNNRIML